MTGADRLSTRRLGNGHGEARVETNPAEGVDEEERAARHRLTAAARYLNASSPPWAPPQVEPSSSDRGQSGSQSRGLSFRGGSTPVGTPSGHRSVETVGLAARAGYGSGHLSLCSDGGCPDRHQGAIRPPTHKEPGGIAAQIMRPEPTAFSTAAEISNPYTQRACMPTVSYLSAVLGCPPRGVRPGQRRFVSLPERFKIHSLAETLCPRSLSWLGAGRPPGGVGVA
jgi:hypothetical protein